MNGLIEKSVPLSYASLRGEEEYEVRGYVEADREIEAELERLAFAPIPERLTCAGTHRCKRLPCFPPFLANPVFTVIGATLTALGTYPASPTLLISGLTLLGLNITSSFAEQCRHQSDTSTWSQRHSGYIRLGVGFSVYCLVGGLKLSGALNGLPAESYNDNTGPDFPSPYPGV